MDSFQEHFLRLQEIYDQLVHGETDLDQAMLLQQEAQKHIGACQTILSRYDTQINFSHETDSSAT